MDKYEATKILTGELVKRQGRLVVSDEFYKKKLRNEAGHIYVIGDDVRVMFHPWYDASYWKKEKKKGEVKKESITSLLENQIPSEANYLFCSDKEIKGTSSILIDVTPYSIIGSKEIESIKRLFYKNYNPKIRDAIDSLEIKDYFEVYNRYINNDANFLEFLKFRREFITFLKDVLEEIKDRGIPPEKIKSRFDFDKVNKNLGLFGIGDYYRFGHNKHMPRDDLEYITKLLEERTWLPQNLPESYSDFFKLAFEIPYEDQNIEANKIIFREFKEHLSIHTILLREYQGRYFKEYFELLNEKQQREVAGIVKRSGLEKKPDYDSFLWDKGYKEIEVDYFELYRKDAQVFINYFKSRTAEEKKIILEDILGCEHMNQEVIDWLDANEPELLKEASFNG